MILNKNICITISYKLKNEEQWYDLTVNAMDYFDKDYCDESEEITIDSLPLYDHAIDYISSVKKCRIKNTKLYLVDEETNERIIIKESFWNAQKNSIVERVDIDAKGTISNHELILTTLAQEDANNKVWEIMRFSETEHIFTKVFHSYITEDNELFLSENIVNND